MRILLVEDHPELGAVIDRRLRRAGHTIDWVQNGRDAIRYLEHGPWDIILLDIMLPDYDGFHILETLRKQQITSPVLVMTARTEIEDKVSMLDIGADDYLVKPFDLRELEARIRALIRRPLGQTSNVFSIGPIQIDSKARRIIHQEQSLDFGLREFCLLELLLSRLDHAVSKERLIVQLFNFDEDASPNAVELHISRLRRKTSAFGLRIETIRGVGYSATFAPSPNPL